MRYTDSPFSPRPSPVPNPTYPPQMQPPTNDDIITHLVRMETRLVKLMYHVGLDANGRVREEN